ncbi:hypothetical protein ACJX0J_034999, partial [Zea mays]
LFIYDFFFEREIQDEDYKENPKSDVRVGESLSETKNKNEEVDNIDEENGKKGGDMYNIKGQKIMREERVITLVWTKRKRDWKRIEIWVQNEEDPIEWDVLEFGALQAFLYGLMENPRKPRPS